MRIYLSIFISVLFFASCNRGNSSVEYGGGSGGNVPDNGGDPSVVNEKLPPAIYVKWVEDESHGLKREKAIDEMIYSAQYKPSQYIVCEEDRKTSLADSSVKKQLAQLGNMQYFNLKIAVKDGQGELLKYKLSSEAEYQDRVNYFSFGMQKDIQLVDGKDTLPCLLYHYERVYDVAPYGIFLLGFAPGKNSNGDKTLIIFDKGFNKGIVKLFFEGKDIKYLPQLETI